MKGGWAKLWELGCGDATDRCASLIVRRSSKPVVQNTGVRVPPRVRPSPRVWMIPPRPNSTTSRCTYEKKSAISVEEKNVRVLSVSEPDVAYQRNQRIAEKLFFFFFLVLTYGLWTAPSSPTQQAWHASYGDLPPNLYRRCKRAWDTVVGKGAAEEGEGRRTTQKTPCILTALH